MGAAAVVGIHASDEHVHAGHAQTIRQKLDELSQRNLPPDDFHAEMKAYFASLHPPDWQHPELKAEYHQHEHHQHHHAHIHHGAMSEGHHNVEEPKPDISHIRAANAKKQHNDGDEDHQHEHEHKHHHPDPVKPEESPVVETADSTKSKENQQELSYDGQAEPPKLEEDE